MRPPKRFLPSIASLRALEALDRLGSATAVAEELHQTQSAVSRQLRSLEDSLGQTLFMREAKRLQLTPEARSYAAEIRQALGQIAQASMRLSFNPHGGTINLAILPTFGMRWLVPRLSDFARLHPEVSINLTTHIGSINFASEPFDAAIVFGSDIPPSTDSLTLKPERVIAVCAPSVMSESGVRPISAPCPCCTSPVGRMPGAPGLTYGGSAMGRAPGRSMISSPPFCRLRCTGWAARCCRIIWPKPSLPPGDWCRFWAGLLPAMVPIV